MTKLGAELIGKRWVIHNVENHQILGSKLLFVEEQVVLHNNIHCISMDENLNRTVLVQISNMGKMHLITCTAQTVNKSISDHYAPI